MKRQSFIKLVSVFFIFFFSNSNAIGQNIDSLLEIESQIIEPTEQYDHSIQVALLYLNSRQWSNGERYLSKSLQIAESLKDEDKIGKVYYYLGASFHRQRQYNTADSLFFKGLQYKPNQKIAVDLISGRLGTNLRTSDLEATTANLKEMREIIGNDTTGPEMGIYYFELANYHAEQRNLLKKLQYLQKAKKLSEDHPRNMQAINGNLAGVYESLQDYDKGLEIQEELRATAKKENNALGELFSLYGIMTLQHRLKKMEYMIRYKNIMVESSHKNYLTSTLIVHCFILF